MGHIFYLMGKSSSGKDSIYKDIKAALPELWPVVLYTTRPIRQGEQDGVEYYFVDQARQEELERQGRIIELREYATVHGPWRYFTVDDGQVDLSQADYLMIGTLESYEKMREYYGEEALVPIYIEVEDGERLSRALLRERTQETPKYAELCRRFLADSEDFSERNLKKAGITKRFENRDKAQVVADILNYIHGKEF